MFQLYLCSWHTCRVNMFLYWCISISEPQFENWCWWELLNGVHQLRCTLVVLVRVSGGDNLIYITALMCFTCKIRRSFHTFIVLHIDSRRLKVWQGICVIKSLTACCFRLRNNRLQQLNCSLSIHGDLCCEIVETFNRVVKIAEERWDEIWRTRMEF